MKSYRLIVTQSQTTMNPINTPIPQPDKTLDWPAIAAMPVSENHEPLVKLPQDPRIKALPIYAQNGIRGALTDIYLRQSVAKKLLHVAHRLPEAIGLVVLDGWRPLEVQRALRDHVRAQIVAEHPNADDTWINALLDEFVADPDRAGMCPPHLTGGSVDVSLFHIATDQLLDMGSEFDQAGEISYTATLESHTTTTARDHRRILYHTMLQAGFTNLPTEWWHYDFGNSNWAYFSKQAHAQYGAANR